jgi:microcystin-dependent protein
LPVRIFSLNRREELRLLDDASFVSELRPIAFAVTGTGLVEVAPGWLYCNGFAASRATYKRLFDEIGTAYGVGDGSTTFNLPDYRGRSPLPHADGQTGADRVANAGALGNATAPGGIGGADAATVAKTHLPTHVHTNGSLTMTGGSHSHGVGTLGVVLSGGGGTVSGFVANIGAGTTVNLGPQGGGLLNAVHSHATTDFAGATEDGTSDGLGAGSPTHNNAPPHLPVPGMVIRA